MPRDQRFASTAESLGHSFDGGIRMPPDASALCAALARLEAEIHHPGSRCGRERLEQLLHPDFHEVGRSGAPYTRAQVIGYLAERTDIPDAHPTRHRVERLSDTLALLLFDTDEPGPGGRRVRAARRSSLWQKTQAGWQLRYHHATPFDPDGTAG